MCLGRDTLAQLLDNSVNKRQIGVDSGRDRDLLDPFVAESFLGIPPTKNGFEDTTDRGELSIASVSKERG